MKALLQGLKNELGFLCARTAELLVSSMWKGMVLVAVAALLLRCVPRLGAGLRSALWTAVLLLVVVLPALPFGGSAVAGSRESFVQANAAWSFALAGLWAGLSLLRLLQLGGSALRLRRIARRAVPVEAPARIQALIARASRPVTLCVSGDVGRPSVVGFFRPRILLPAGLVEKLSEAEWEHVVLHELEHLRRRDDWTNLLQKLCLALFPLHPALLWLDRRMCLERELACDDAVLRETRARKAYAACLARLAEDSMMRRGLSLALGLLGVKTRGSELGGRVQRILRSPAAAMGRLQAGVAATALLGVVLGGSMLLARSPRLVRFAQGAQPALEAAAPAVLSEPRSEGPVAGLPYHAVAVKATMPQGVRPAARLLRVNATVRPKRRAPLRQFALNRTPQSWRAQESYNVVLTAWQQSTAMPRLTLALAQGEQDSQTTYAAVPVRGGWLLIQL